VATLHFDGTDDYVSGTGSGAMNGALTVFALTSRVFGGSHTLLSTVSSGNTSGFVFGTGSGDNPREYNDNTGGLSTGPDPATTMADDDWWMIVMTRPAGTPYLPRFHVRNHTTSGTIGRGDSENAAVASAPDSASGGTIYAGRMTLPGTGNFDFLSGDLAVLGWWDGTAFNDTQVNEILNASSTSDLYGHSAGQPSSLTEFTSTTPTDLKGLITWTNNGPTATGANPDNFTADGVGTPSTTVLRSRRILI
jgi:hypothetical protein